MSPRGVRILLPISERKRPGGSTTWTFPEAQEEIHTNRFRSLNDARREALKAFLAGHNGEGTAADILRLSGEQLDESKRVNAAFRTAPTLPVADRVSGRLYDALDLPTLEAAARRRARNTLMILCPLLGLLGPEDLVPDYRCPVGARIPGWGSLHAHWKAQLGPVLDRLCRDRLVFSFLPKRMAALWSPSSRVRLVNFEFVRGRGAQGRPDHAAQPRASGEIARHLVERDARSETALEDFRTSIGHGLAARRTNGPVTTLVFAR